MLVYVFCAYILGDDPMYPLVVATTSVGIHIHSVILIDMGRAKSRFKEPLCVRGIHNRNMV